MEDAIAADRAAVYDIRLGRRPPESLRSRFPAMRVRTTRPQTALLRQVSDPAELDALLQDVRAVGLAVTDLHRLPARSGAETDESAEPPATYEVRVAGELGSRLLHHLRCSHYDVPEQTTVRLRVDPTGLTGFLQACTECDVHIERVCRVAGTG